MQKKKQNVRTKILYSILPATSDCYTEAKKSSLTYNRVWKCVADTSVLTLRKAAIDLQKTQSDTK